MGDYTVTGNVRIVGTEGIAGELHLLDSSLNGTIVRTPSVVSSYTVTLPSTLGAPNSFLSYDGISQTYWNTGTPLVYTVNNTTDSDSGQFVAGSWVTRVLNTIETPPSDAGEVTLLSGNRIQLLQGAYLIRVWTPAHRVTSHVARIYNVTDDNVVEYGCTMDDDDVSNRGTYSHISTVFEVGSTTVIRIEDMCLTTGPASNSLGVSVGGTNVFTTCTIFKLA